MTEEKVEAIGGYVTVYKAAELKQAKAGTLYQWLRRHGIPTKRIGKSIIVNITHLELYTPRNAYTRRRD